MGGSSSEVVAPAALGAFLVLAAYLNLNDPDWMLFSGAYTLGAAICGWTVMQSATAKGSAAAQDASHSRRLVAMAYGAVCLVFTAYIVFLAPREDVPNDADNVIIAALSSEIFREAGGVLIMAQAMAQCAFAGRSPSGGSPSFGERGRPLAAVAVAVAVVAAVLGMFLPDYLKRAGIVVPTHCGGED